MLILTCPAQLQRLEGALRRSLPLTLPVYGAVMNINRGNPGEFEVVVDSWPDFGAVLARRSGEVAVGDVGQDGGGMGWARCPGVCQVGSGHPRVLHRCRWMTATGTCTQLSTGMLDPGVRVGSLSPAHVDLLNETWTYGGNARSRRYLAEVLGRFPSVCLQDEAGQPLSWTLTDPFASGAHGYTLPTHRRRGHMRAVLVLAARQAQARGFPSFG
ncbi:GLYL3 protein, partial [Herpetotheres cachinnans]|nr:GLYL3 protein [Herpetotheres cachinnans]